MSKFKFTLTYEVELDGDACTSDENSDPSLEDVIDICEKYSSAYEWVNDWDMLRESSNSPRITIVEIQPSEELYVLKFKEEEA